MKDSARQKDRQRWERKEWASLVEKQPRHVKASPWGRGRGELETPNSCEGGRGQHPAAGHSSQADGARKS